MSKVEKAKCRLNKVPWKQTIFTPVLYSVGEPETNSCWKNETNAENAHNVETLENLRM